MHQHRALFGDASPDAVGTLDLLGPHATKPDSPVFEVVGAVFIAAVMNRHAIFVAQQDYVSLLAHNGIKAIDFFPGLRDHIRSGFLRDLQFAVRDNVGCGPALGIDVIVHQAAVPGIGDFVHR